MVPFEEAEKGLDEQEALGLPKLRMTAAGTFFVCGVTTTGHRILLTDWGTRPATKTGLKFLTKEVDSQPPSTSVTPCLRPLTPNSTEDSWGF